jgi:hypothetical protein
VLFLLSLSLSFETHALLESADTFLSAAYLIEEEQDAEKSE